MAVLETLQLSSANNVTSGVLVTVQYCVLCRMYYHDSMHAISVKIPHSLKLRMETESSRRGLTKSRLIREALENAFGQRTPNRTATVYELTKDLCGSVRGGASDLASNKKHLANYGK